MGGQYSRMQGIKFPPGYLALGFRQPDCLLLMNFPPDLLSVLRDHLQVKWQRGIKSEKRYPLGVEIRLASEPFANDSSNVQISVACYKLCGVLLEELLHQGCELVTTGHYIRGIERNIWLMHRPSEELREQKSASPPSVSVVGMEDWSKVLLINCSSDVFEMAKYTLENIWSTGISRTEFQHDHGVVELNGQPWDSYKTESEKTPLMLKRLVEVMMTKGYRLYISTHIRGVIDTLFFLRNQQADHCANEQIMLLSLNQQDQLRFYEAPSNVVHIISKLVRESWAKGQVSDEMQGGLWTMRLKGSPWWVAEWDKDLAMAARELVTGILRALNRLGWQVLETVELYRSQYDKSLFVLTLGSGGGGHVVAAKSLDYHYFCVSSHDVDRLCIAGAPAEVQGGFKNIIMEHWTRIVKQDSESTGYIEFCLGGQPWQWDPDNTNLNIESVGLLCWIHHRLVCQNWELVTSADISSGTKYSPHTLVFKRLMEGGALQQQQQQQRKDQTSASTSSYSGSERS